jgi:hypothetical protein
MKEECSSPTIPDLFEKCIWIYDKEEEEDNRGKCLEKSEVECENIKRQEQCLDFKINSNEVMCLYDGESGERTCKTKCEHIESEDKCKEEGREDCIWIYDDEDEEISTGKCLESERVECESITRQGQCEYLGIGFISYLCFHDVTCKTRCNELKTEVSCNSRGYCVYIFNDEVGESGVCKDRESIECEDIKRSSQCTSILVSSNGGLVSCYLYESGGSETEPVCLLSCPENTNTNNHTLTCDKKKCEDREIVNGSCLVKGDGEEICYAYTSSYEKREGNVCISECPENTVEKEIGGLFI